MRLPASMLAAMLLLTSFSGSAAGLRDEIKVASYSGYAGSDGRFHVVGEVQNNLGAAVGGVKVYAIFYDPDGGIIATKAAGAFIDDLRPGEKSPFSIALADPGDVAKMASYRLVAASSRPPEIREPYLSVQVGQGRVDEEGVYQVSGKVINYGEKQATGVVVAASFYDAANQIVYVASRHFPAGIEQTETLNFEFQLDGINASRIAYASANAYCSEYSSMAGAWKSRYSLTLATDSSSYGSGQEIRVAGNVTATDGYVIIEIRRSDRVLHDKATARVMPDGHYETAVKFYALPEYLGQDFIVKARYRGSFAETTFQFK